MPQNCLDSAGMVLIRQPTGAVSVLHGVDGRLAAARGRCWNTGGPSSHQGSRQRRRTNTVCAMLHTRKAAPTTTGPAGERPTRDRGRSTTSEPPDRPGETQHDIHPRGQRWEVALSARTAEPSMTESESGSSFVRRWQLAAALKDLREKAGLTQGSGRRGAASWAGDGPSRRCRGWKTAITGPAAGGRAAPRCLRRHAGT